MKSEDIIKIFKYFVAPLVGVAVVTQMVDPPLTDFERKAGASLTYWNEAHRLDHHYGYLLDSIVQHRQDCTTFGCMGNSMMETATLVQNWMQQEESFPVVEVDSGLVYFFKRGREFHDKEVTILQKLGQLYMDRARVTCTDNPCDSVFQVKQKLLSDRLDKLSSEFKNRYDWSKMRIQLSQKYKQDFLYIPPTPYRKK